MPTSSSVPYPTPPPGYTYARGLSRVAKAGIALAAVGFLVSASGAVFLGSTQLGYFNCLTSGAGGASCVGNIFNDTGWSYVIIGVGVLLVGIGITLVLYAALTRLEGVPRMF
ncbi:MAG TPA: hypothetical protein VJS68_00610 [Thermoplasmata archaeon]|nr:hypothetical protein [Thermoplasmata archaeon]